MNSIIEWFVKNRIGADLLMMFIMVAGSFSVSNMRSEIIPNISLDQIAISVAYPGASPESVEKIIINPIEAAIYDVEGIKSVSSKAVEHGGVVTAEIGWGFDPKHLLNEIKARVDGISTFPQEVMKPVIQELSVRNLVSYVVISGEADEHSLRAIAAKVKEDLLAIKTISQVELTASRDYEVTIEVSESTLQRYNMSFAEVAQAVKLSTMESPGGVVKTAQGEVSVRVRGQAYDPEQLEDIVIRAMPDGGRITLADVSKINDGFKDGARSRFNGKPAVVLSVYRVGNQSIVDISEALHTYADHPTTYIPDGVKLDVWQDTTVYYNSRMDLLKNDGWQGGLLVFIILLLFLRSEVAFWISASVPVSFLGAIILLPMFDVSFNMISMFAFILVLGIVVDEAIVIGENIFSHRRRGVPGVQAAIIGTQELFFPMLFSVMTTSCAFVPLMMLPGPEGKLMSAIPIVVVCTLFVSVVEAAFCLPAHLANAKDDVYDNVPFLGSAQRAISTRLDSFLEYRYRPFLEKCLEWRYSVIIAFVCMLLISIGLLVFGWLKIVMFSQIEGDSARAHIRFSENSTRTVADAGVTKLEQAALEIKRTFKDENGRDQILSIYTSYSPDNSGTVIMEFLASEERQFSGEEVVKEWRRLVGDIPDVADLDFVSTLTPAGTMIDIELISNSADDLRLASQALKSRLAEFDGLYAIGDSLQTAKQELVIQLKPTARNMGLTLDQVAFQVRQAYHGAEVQRFTRVDGDVSVTLRYPDSDRSSLWNLENMSIRMTNGKTVPLMTVADIEYGESASEIKHHQRHRVVRVTAKVDEAATSLGKVMVPLKADFLDKISQEYPGMHWGIAGSQKDREEFTDYLVQAYALALIGMYVLMAFQFRSYGQPFMVMIVIPFGLIGALLGHLIIGIDVTIWSLVGMVAVSGVVVNDNLVLIDHINECRRRGEPLSQAIRNAGVQRFRAVFLISSTTMVGLLPMIAEKSLQAQFMIPMAVALGFGTMFSSTISLILVPSLYYVSEDLSKFLKGLFNFGGKTEETYLEPISIASSVDKTFTNSDDESEKLQWHVGLDEAYEIGYQAAISSKPKKAPFDLEVLVASWEAGWDDGREELRLRETGATD